MAFRFLPCTNIDLLSGETLKKYSCSFWLFSFRTFPLFKHSHCVLSLEGWWRVQSQPFSRLLRSFLSIQCSAASRWPRIPLAVQMVFLEFIHKLGLSLPGQKRMRHNHCPCAPWKRVDSLSLLMHPSVCLKKNLWAFSCRNSQTDFFILEWQWEIFTVFCWAPRPCS